MAQKIRRNNSVGTFYIRAVRMLKTSQYFSWAPSVMRNFWLKVMLIFKIFSHLKKRRNSNVALSSTDSSATKIQQKQRLIPRSKGLPLVGTFIDLIAAGAAPKLHKYINRRHKQFGPIFRERLGGTQDAVFVASASLMRKVFDYEGRCPRHPLPDAWTLYNKTHKCERGLFFMEGEEWLNNRRVLNRLLLLGNLDWMQAPIDASTERFVNAWKIKASARDHGAYVEIIDLEQQLYRWAIDVICAIMFGSGTNPASLKIELALNDFARSVHKIFEHSALLMNFPPHLAKTLNMKMWTQFEQSVSEALQKGSAIIDMFMALENDEEVAADEDTETLFQKLQAAEMPLELIKRIFVDLVIAAGDTTAYSSEWALYLLSQDDKLQHRLAKEVSVSGVDDMTLVHGLIKETLRLYPVAPFIGRYLATDAVIDDYHIEKDTLVLLSLYTAGRDAQHFPDPLTVQPERWQQNAQTNKRQNVLKAHGSLPFATGQRSCIGRKIATNQMHSLIKAIVCNFHLKCTNTQPIECVLRLVTVPSQPLQLVIRIRGGDENA